MTTIASEIEFENLSAFFCGRMISSDRETRLKAAADAGKLILDLPDHLRNSPHCRDEIDALVTLIARVYAEPSPTPALPAVPADGWGSVTWDDVRTRVVCTGRPAAENMPDYVSLQFVGNAFSASACLTPADARRVAAMLLQAANNAEEI